MIGHPPGPEPRPAPTRFSPDGFWWWDGAQWRQALSQDRLWRWNGQAWVPAQTAPGASAPPGARSGSGMAIGLVVSFAAVLVLVGFVVIVILLTMGNQIANVFSNVAAALVS